MWLFGLIFGSFGFLLGIGMAIFVYVVNRKNLKGEKNEQQKQREG